MIDKNKDNPERNSSEPAKPETLARVIQSSQKLLDALGVERVHTPGNIKMMSAKVPLDDTDLTTVQDGMLPTLKITKPTEDLAKRARWSYEISYSMGDAAASRHILVMNDEIPQAEIGAQDRTPTHILTEAEAQIVASDLGRLASA